ncbi:MAG: hypothetical protein FWG50_00625 [Kiritimatiellaeota bacterium]|nr:hypothetical protein [Kiritimatiellota bacterium]
MKLKSFLRVCCALPMFAVWYPFAGADEAPRPVKALSEKEQAAFLSKRTGGSMLGSFNGFCSLLYAACEVAIHTESQEINATQLKSFIPAFYKPTWREMFDAIALQTQSEWRYDAARGYWVFAKPQKPQARYSIEVASEWEQDNQGACICYRPPVAPVGMDIYTMGAYSSDDPEGANDLHKKVRDHFAVTFAKMFKEDVTPADMKEAAVNNYPALHFEINAQTGIIWRQWVIVEAGKAFVIVSAIKPEHDAHIYPDVKKMMGSFKVLK